MHFHEFAEMVEAHATAWAAMNRKWHIVLLSGLENRPEEFVAIGFSEIRLRRQHHRRKTNAFVGTSRDFPRCRFRVLDRHDARPVEPFVLRGKAVFKPVVIRLDRLHRPFRIRNQPGCKTRGRIQNGSLCADDLQHFSPDLCIGMSVTARFAVIRRHDEPARPAIEAGPYTEGFKTLQVGEIPLEIGCDLVVVFQYVTVAIENFKPINCHLFLLFLSGCYWINSRSPWWQSQ